MRGLIAPLVAALLTVAPTPRAQAAPRSQPANTLTVEPLAAIFTRTISLEYERAVTDLFTLYLAPAFTFDSVSSDGGDVSFIAVGGAVGARFFPWSPAPTGLFFGPFAQLSWAEAERGDAQADGVGFAAGALAGYTWLLGELFDLSLGVGAAYWDLTVTVDGVDEGRRGVLPVARVAVGVAF